MRQIKYEDEENEIIIIDHKHQNRVTRVQRVYRPFTFAAGMSNKKYYFQNALH